MAKPEAPLHLLADRERVLARQHRRDPAPEPLARPPRRWAPASGRSSRRCRRGTGPRSRCPSTSTISSAPRLGEVDREGARPARHPVHRHAREQRALARARSSSRERGCAAAKRSALALEGVSDNLERYREALDAWNRRDLVWILEQAAPDLEFHTAQLFPGIEPVYRGREGMVEFWTTFIEEPWALFRLDVESMRAVGDDRVLALITFHGTERDSGRGGRAHVRAPGDLPRRARCADRRLRRLGRGPQGRRAREPECACFSTSRSRSSPTQVDDAVAFWRLLGFERGRLARGARRLRHLARARRDPDPPDPHRGARRVPVLGPRRGRRRRLRGDARARSPRPATRSRRRASCGARGAPSRSAPAATGWS